METTMNPATRILKRIEFEDIIEAGSCDFSLMGEKFRQEGIYRKEAKKRILMFKEADAFWQKK